MPDNIYAYDWDDDRDRCDECGREFGPMVPMHRDRFCDLCEDCAREILPVRIGRPRSGLARLIEALLERIADARPTR